MIILIEISTDKNYNSVISYDYDCDYDYNLFI